MTYKSGSWGVKAKQRSKKRTKYFVEYRKKTKDKVRARNLIYSLVKKGFLQKGCCYLVGNNCHGRIEAHHHDYTKPLEIKWLCSFHHRQEHTKMKQDNIEKVR